MIDDLANALRAMVVAVTPDPKLPQAQNDAYLQAVALPRAREVLARYDSAEKKHCVWHGRYKAFCNECKKANGEPRLI